MHWVRGVELDPVQFLPFGRTIFVYIIARFPIRVVAELIEIAFASEATCSRLKVPSLKRLKTLNIAVFYAIRKGYTTTETPQKRIAPTGAAAEKAPSVSEPGFLATNRGAPGIELTLHREPLIADAIGSLRKHIVSGCADIALPMPVEAPARHRARRGRYAKGRQVLPSLDQ